MNLYIKMILINKNGHPKMHIHFKRGLSVVSDTPELRSAVELVLGKKETVRTSYDIDIAAMVCINKKNYVIVGNKKRSETVWKSAVYTSESENDCSKEYFELIDSCREIDLCNSFDYYEHQNFPQRIMNYKDELNIYPDGAFSALTNGYGTTRSFRAFMSQYIKNFKPIKLARDKELLFKISDSGEFTVCKKDDDKKVFLSASENTLYHFFSFIALADFWRRAEKIRNLNMVNKPLLITNLVQKIDQSTDLSDILERSSKIDRQVIIFAPYESFFTQYYCRNYI